MSETLKKFNITPEMKKQIENPKYKYCVLSALILNHFKKAKKLIEENADINAQHHKTGYTALTYALDRQYLDIVELLMEQKNIDVNPVTHNKNSALILAIKNKNKDIIKKIIDLKPNIDVQNSFGKTAIMLAIEENVPYKLIKKMIKSSKNLELRDNNDNTLLLYVTKYGCYKITKLLLKYKCNINVKNKYGNTVLTGGLKMCRNGNKEFLKTWKVLIENGCNINDIKIDYLLRKLGLIFLFGDYDKMYDYILRSIIKKRLKPLLFQCIYFIKNNKKLYTFYDIRCLNRDIRKYFDLRHFI